MNDASGSVRVSLRLADGEHYPIFRYGDPDTRNLSLVPATEGQSEADIQFFHHPADGSSPRRLGIVRFPDLPAESQDVELHLDAAIGPTGLLTVTVRSRDTGRMERLEMELPADESPRAAKDESSARHPLRWIFGTLFVLACLVLIFMVTRAVTQWGREEPVEAPISLHRSIDAPPAT